MAMNRLEPHCSAFLGEKAFLKALCLERRRAERSRKALLLALVRQRGVTDRGLPERLSRVILEADRAIAPTIRETDVRGWYQEFSTYGLIFTEFNDAPRRMVHARISEKVRSWLRDSLRPEHLERLEISLHFYPEEESGSNQSSLPDRSLYPDLAASDGSAKLSRAVKRAIDVFGSAIGIIGLSPLLATIAILVKLSSRGPILFKQTRIGQYGARFTFLKFRSMTTASDPRIHEDYVKGYIRGKQGAKQTTGQGSGAYKLTKDPRITRLGYLLRKASLDELPQLFNVLRGDMSLVGPRPPIPYELEAYDVWHRRRLLEARPGITGLWQVMGRSRTTFDEMVRLDLRYACAWSLWLDVKILLLTPRAVVSGNGAY